MNGKTVGELIEHLSKHHPAPNDLKSPFIAVSQNYADDQVELKEIDEIAIIPPVSGG